MEPDEEISAELRKFFEGIRNKRDADRIREDEFTRSEFARQTGHSYEACGKILAQMLANGALTARDGIIRDGKKSQIYKLVRPGTPIKTTPF